MIYADYDFYRDVFLGNKIPEAEFPRYAKRASERIDEVTFGRITEADISVKVREACCAAAEELYASDTVGSKAAYGVVSEKSGDCSVTYAQYAAAPEQLVTGRTRSIIKGYLKDTGLMYRGCG